MSNPPVNPLSQLSIQQTGRSWVTRKFAPLQQGSAKTWRTTAFGDAYFINVLNVGDDGLPSALKAFTSDANVNVGLFVHDAPTHLSGRCDYSKSTTGGTSLTAFVAALNANFAAIAAAGCNTVAPPYVPTPLPDLTLPVLPGATIPAACLNTVEWDSIDTTPSNVFTVYGVPVNVIFNNAQNTGPLAMFPCRYEPAPSSGVLNPIWEGELAGMYLSCITQAAAVQGLAGVSQGRPPLVGPPPGEGFVPIILRADDLTDAIVDNGMEFSIPQGPGSSLRFIVVGVHNGAAR
jgi:hypothetical protein